MPDITLAEMISQIDTDLGRDGTKNAQIKRGIQYAVLTMRRKGFHFTERRHAKIKTTASQAWYATFSNEQPTDTDQQDDLSEIQFSFDEPAYGGTVDELVRVDEAWHVDTSGRMTEVKQVGLSEFNSMRANPFSAVKPTHFVYNSQNIGFYPTPSAAGEYIFFYGRFHPYYPTGDEDTCVFFDQAEHLVIAHARYWLATNVFRDVEDAQIQQAEITRLTQDIRQEGNDRLRTNRVAAHI